MVALKPLAKNDLPILFDWYQDEDLFSLLVGPYIKRSKSEAIDYMQTHWLNADDGQDLRRMIYENDTPVGTVALTCINMNYRSAYLNIFIYPKNKRRKGLGKKAMALILEEGFRKLGLHRIYLDVLSENIPARELYKTIGFQEEGIARDAAIKNGKFVDVVHMSLLEYEFQSL